MMINGALLPPARLSDTVKLMTSFLFMLRRESSLKNDYSFIIYSPSCSEIA